MSVFSLTFLWKGNFPPYRLVVLFSFSKIFIFFNFNDFFSYSLTGRYSSHCFHPMSTKLYGKYSRKGGILAVNSPITNFVGLLAFCNTGLLIMGLEISKILLLPVFIRF